MIKIVISSALLLFPVFAAAELHRCTAANGAVSYQDLPCPGASARNKSAAAKADTPTPAGSNPSGFTVYSPATPPPRVAESAKATNGISARNEQIDAHNKKIEATNRASRCDRARHELGVLSEQRPVFSYDTQGERQYIDDAARAKRISAARESISQNCK